MTDVLEKIILLYIGTNEKNLVYAKYSSSALCGCIKQFILKKIPISEEIFIKHITEPMKQTVSLKKNFASNRKDLDYLQSGSLFG